jgi:hypothetical protein
VVALNAGGSRCPFSGGAAARYAALAQRLLQQPITVTLPDGTSTTLGYSQLVGFTLGAMYDSSSWPDFAAMLADIEQQASAQRIGLRAERFRGPALYIPKRGIPHYVNFVEGFPAVACADSDNPDSYEAWWNAGIAADAVTGYFRRIWTWASGICASWDHIDADRYMGPFNKRTCSPVLIVGNQFDPATPYHGAVTVAGPLPNSALLTVHGLGPHLAGPVRVRRRDDRALPRRPHHPGARNRVRTGRRTVQPVTRTSPPPTPRAGGNGRNTDRQGAGSSSPLAAKPRTASRLVQHGRLLPTPRDASLRWRDRSRVRC